MYCWKQVNGSATWTDRQLWLRGRKECSKIELWDLEHMVLWGNGTRYWKEERCITIEGKSKQSKKDMILYNDIQGD
jgi:hypothetical protein